MTDKVKHLGKIGDIRLDLVPKLADCNPGLQPVEYNIIVAPAEPPKTVGKMALIIAPDSTKENTGLAMQVGRLVTMSALAFNYDVWPEGAKPQAGQIVWFARYAGSIFEGADGREYRIMKDKDIGAVVPEEASAAMSVGEGVYPASHQQRSSLGQVVLEAAR